MNVLEMSPRLRELVPRDGELTQIATGFKFTEGPVWDADGNRLLFSDILGDTIYAWSQGTETVSVLRRPSLMSNGLTFDRAGRLLACEHAGRRVSRQARDGTVVTLAGSFEGKVLNSPNDVVVRSDGTVYFTDPAFGLTREFGILRDQEVSVQGVYCLTPDGELKQVVTDFAQPNGLAFSPDEKRLYIDDSAKQHVRVFDVREDGSVVNGRLFAELDSTQGEGVPDGLKVDYLGNVYVTGPGGVWVFDAAGNPLGLLRTPEVAANLAWGGADAGTLLITATTSVYQMRLSTHG